MEQAVFLDLEVRWKSVLVPSEEDAGGDGFDIHGRCFEDPPVFRLIFDHLFMEHLVLAPAGNGVKIFKVVGEGRDVKIAPDEVGGVAILLARLEVLADHELKKADRVVGHGVDINQCVCAIQA